MIIGRQIVHRASLGSTMDLLDEFARAGAAEGLVVRTDAQTAGRGRGGRTWESPPGGVYCSVLLRPNLRADQIGALSLVVGVAIAEALEQLTPVRCQLRWPNDVLVGGQKIAGVLIQSRLGTELIDFVNVGIGIDVAQPLTTLPPVATTLHVAANDESIAVDHVFAALLERLERWYTLFVDAAGRPSLDQWRARAAYLGTTVSVRGSSGDVTGVMQGIDDAGRLLLLMSDGNTRPVIQGDLMQDAPACSLGL